VTKRRKPLPAARRRAIGVLTDTGPLGVTEGALLANGPTVQLLAELERDGMVVSTISRERAGAEMIDVKRVRITEAGSKAIEVGWSFRCRSRPAVGSVVVSRV
jgi:hypothetical protein